MIVTSWLTLRTEADALDVWQQEAGRTQWSQRSPRVDVCKCHTSPLVHTRPAVPVLVSVDPYMVWTVRMPVELRLPGVDGRARFLECGDIPPPPSLTGQIVIRV